MADSIKSYRDLNVWQMGLGLAEACYRLTRQFPKEELYGLVSQARRAAASVPANIAEGHGRESRGEFIQFLRIAQGSLKELETHFLLAQRLGYCSESDLAELLGDAERIGKMLRSLIRTLQAKQAGS